MSKAEQTCERIIDYLIQEGYKLQVHKRDIAKPIMHLKGVDERTIARWLKALIIFEYLKPITPDLYQLNPMKIPKLMHILKDHPQVKLQ